MLETKALAYYHNLKYPIEILEDERRVCRIHSRPAGMCRLRRHYARGGGVSEFDKKHIHVPKPLNRAFLERFTDSEVRILLWPYFRVCDKRQREDAHTAPDPSLRNV
jgi:hypothetical protein